MLECSSSIREPIENLAFSSNNDIVVLTTGSLTVYNNMCGKRWSVSFDESKPRYFSVGPEGQIALTIIGYADYDVYYSGGKSYYTFAPTGIRIYSEGGVELSRLPGFWSSWSNEGLIASWYRGPLYVYQGKNLLWERAFLGSVRKVTVFNDKIGVLVEPLGTPIVLSTDGETLWNFSGDMIVSDGYFQHGYFIVTGYDSERSYFYVYDSSFREVLSYRSPSFKDKEYYEIIVPILALSEKGSMAAGIVVPTGTFQIKFYDFGGGSGNKTVVVGEDLKPLKLEWISGDRLLFVTDREAGLVSIDGNIVFRAKMGEDDKNDACFLGGDKIAVLDEGRVKIYTLSGEKIWEDQFTTSLTSCTKGLLAKASYSTLEVVDNVGKVLWRDQIHDDKITFLKWLGDRLVVSTLQGKLILYDSRGQKTFEDTIAPYINYVTMALKDILAVGTDGGLYLIRFKHSGKVFLKIRLLSEAFSVTVDGERYQGPVVSIKVGPGRHNVQVDEEVEQEKCIYRFDKWSDGVKSPARDINIQDNTTIEALYAPARCLVKAVSKYGHVYGGGWYAFGTIAKINVTDKVVDFDNGTRIVFDGWSTGEKSSMLEIKVEKGIEVEALWRKQYLVTVKSTVGEILGEGWYDSGDVARIELKETIVNKDGKEYVFKGWLINGESVGADQTVRVRVDRPLVVEARWEERETAGGRLPLEYMIMLFVLAILTGTYIFLRFIRKRKIKNKN